jgi:hypothetical protein
VLQSLPSGVAVAGFSNPHFDYANERGQGVNTIEAIAFESGGDLVATGGRCMGNVRNCSGDQIGVARLTPPDPGQHVRRWRGDHDRLG